MLIVAPHQPGKHDKYAYTRRSGKRRRHPNEKRQAPSGTCRSHQPSRLALSATASSYPALDAPAVNQRRTAQPARLATLPRATL